MKKYLLLIAAFGIFIFTSCSSDDDAGGEERSIEATWSLTSMSPQVFDFSCSEDHTITFNGNGTTNWTVYDSNNECEGVSSSGTWKKNSGDSYTISIPNIGSFDGTVNFISDNKFTFSTTYQGVPVVLTFEK